MPISLSCLSCGSVFLVSPYRVERKQAKYCSYACRARAQRGDEAHRWQGGKIAVPCLTCGKEVERFPSRLKGSGGRAFCSHACTAARKGPDSNAWEGGRNAPSPNGYVRVLLPDGRRIQEHRYVMEQHLGRPLRKDEHVHHINENKLDNRVENLRVMTNSEHRRLHALSHKH